MIGLKLDDEYTRIKENYEKHGCQCRKGTLKLYPEEAHFLSCPDAYEGSFPILANTIFNE
jgi:hypothetical protein